MTQPEIQNSFNLALQHHQAGRLQEAEQIYRQILALQPEHVGAMHYLGLKAHQVGQNDIALDLVRRVLVLRPDYPDAHGLLATIMRAQGHLDEAILAQRKAISLDPNYAEAYCNLGNALKDGGQLNEAITAYRQAIAINPSFAEAHYNLGVVLNELFRSDAAIAAFRQAISLSPNYADAHNDLGSALREKGLLDEAIATLRRALAFKPDDAHIQGNLGNALKDVGQLDLAIAAYREAIKLSPDAHGYHSNLILSLPYHPAYSNRAIAEELRRWNLRHAEPVSQAHGRTQRQIFGGYANQRSSDRRLRVGYISPDFRAHVVARNLLPLFRQHDRTQYEITCYAQVRRPDAMTCQFQQLADRWRSIVGILDEQVDWQIREDQIDILVDLALHTAENRLLVFAGRPAPVQVTFAGYPGSTGLGAIDYRLSDSYLDPLGMDESVYSEKTIRLPDSFWCYDPLEGRAIPVNPLPALDSGIVTFGCLNNFCKINDGVLCLWARVLRQIPSSRLLMLTYEGSHRQRALDRLGQEGIDPARIEFASRRTHEQYLELYHRIDIGLDSFPYNGHTTSLDSFWMGVPVVTRVGETAVSRAGWCQLSNLGLGELAGETPDQFVRIAVELAKNLTRLQSLRASLRQRMERSPLMDAPNFARGIEAAYRRMWRTWCGA